MNRSTNTRRDFLKVMGAGLTALALPGCREAAREEVRAPIEEPFLPQVGLQLWTLREAITLDLAGTLRRVAEVGYAGVETAFWPEGVTVEQAGRLLREVGLPVLAAHAELPVGDQQAAMLAMAEAYDCDRMVWHGWPEDPRYGNEDGIKQLAEIYNKADAFARSNGLRFGLHNHWWEFRRLGDRYPFYMLLELVEPDVFFELDTYWIRTAGLEPARVVADFGRRAPLLHIKDGHTFGPDEPMVAVGQGAQNVPAISRFADHATEWMIVELDRCETDLMEAVEQSYRYLTVNGLARGREPA